MDVDLEREVRRTRPDYVVYKPGSADGTTFDTGNGQFLVFDAPDGALMAVWTKSSYEGAGDHRIVLARSDDEGVTWRRPRRLAGPRSPGSCPDPSRRAVPQIRIFSLSKVLSELALAGC